MQAVTASLPLRFTICPRLHSQSGCGGWMGGQLLPSLLFTGPSMEKGRDEPGERQGWGNTSYERVGAVFSGQPTHFMLSMPRAVRDASLWQWLSTNLMSPGSLFEMQSPKQCPQWLRSRDLYF